jgi:hypothetical protein
LHQSFSGLCCLSIAPTLQRQWICFNHLKKETYHTNKKPPTGGFLFVCPLGLP